MKVFIENEAGSDQKNIYNEKTLEYKKTVTVSRKYPYPYGFILDTTSEDGDNLDVFVITDKRLKSGQVVECEPVGLMEQIETTWDKSNKNKEEEDHNVLAVFPEEKIIINDQVKAKLRDFVLHVFDLLPNKKVSVGKFLDKDTAIQYIEKCKDN
ncbi:inorganic diphosphatase [Patescibacteria group bacterium]